MKAWSDTQNVFARDCLKHLPNVTAIRERLTQIMTAKTISYGLLAHRKGHLFAIKREPPKQQPFLIVLPSADAVDQARVLVDPNKIDPKGTTAIDWYVPSPDGKLVAVSLSRGGSEAGDVHVFNTATGEEVHEVVPHVNGGTAGGDLAWMPDGSGFFYTRYPKTGRASGRGSWTFISRSITTSSARRPRPTATSSERISRAWPKSNSRCTTPPDTLLATVQKGDGGQFSLYLRSPGGHWKKICGFDDQIVQATFGPNDTLYLISREDAPNGKILRVPLSNPDIKRAKTIIPEGPDAVVTSFCKTPPTSRADGEPHLRSLPVGRPDRAARLRSRRQAAAGSRAVAGLDRRRPDAGSKGTTFCSATHRSSRRRPSIKFDSQSGHTYKTQMATASPVDFSDVEVVRKFTTSKDGTRDPRQYSVSRRGSSGTARIPPSSPATAASASA